MSRFLCHSLIFSLNFLPDVKAPRAQLCLPAIFHELHEFIGGASPLFAGDLGGAVEERKERKEERKGIGSRN